MRPSPPGGFGARVPQLAPLAAVVVIAVGAIVAFVAGLGGSGSSSGGDVRVHGQVLNAAGRPLAGAVVADTVTGDRTRTSRSGAYSLVLSPGRRVLAASFPGYAGEARTIVLSGSASADFSLWSLQPTRQVVNSADRMLFWFDCPRFAALSDATLGRLKRQGVDGVVCESGRLTGLGGTAAFTPSLRSLTGARYSLERRLRESGIVGRAKRLGMRSYIAFYASNPSNKATPFVDWFDDSGWNRTVLPAVRNLAGAARALGFDGLAIDQELYDSKTATWSWTYPGNRRPEAAVRAKVRQRGAQLMRAMVTSFPGVELVAYGTQFAGGWEAHVHEANGAQNTFATFTQLDMWDGIASVPGYSAIRWLDAAFYKAVQVSGATWDDALRYEARAVYSLLSRRFSNWAYAASRFYVTPFSWIDTGPCGCAFESARPPDYVAAQLAAFRRWGTGRTFANYAYRGPDGFDYAPYVQTMRAASRPGIVDSQAPRLSLSSPNATPKHGRASITGTATDDFAVRLIAWRDGLGDEGVAKLTADVGSPDGAAVRWSIAGIPVVGGSNTVWLRAEDIHGLSAVARVRIRG